MIKVRYNKEKDVRWIPRRDPETEAMLDKDFTRIGRLKWKGKNLVEKPAERQISNPTKEPFTQG